jgi:hypothetical protein
MSEDSTERHGDEAALLAAQVERDLARVSAEAEASRRQEAEAVRDTAIDLAAQQAAHRDVAELVARNEAYIRQETEKAALNAQIRANQATVAAAEVAAERNILRRSLVAERKSASNATFGLAMLAFLVLVGLIAGGIWYFSQNNTSSTAAAGGAPGVVASTSASRASDVSPPPRTPATIHVNPAPAEVTPTATAPRPEPQTTAPVSGGVSGINVGGAIDPARANTNAPTGSLSDTAPGSDASLPTGSSSSGSTAGTAISGSDSGTSRETKNDNP